MRLCNCSVYEFYEKMNNKKCIVFGCGNFFENTLLKRYSKIINMISYFVDNGKSGQIYKQGGKQIPIHSVKCLMDEKQENMTVIICAGNIERSMEMYDELNAYPLLQDVECYIANIMISKTTYYPKPAEYLQSLKQPPKINKLIHCFWFSKEEKPELQKRCMESWKRYCPDYEIKEWNMENYDITKNRFMQQAVSKKKWAFASDYARLDVIYRYGGIYLDLDVELVQGLDEVLHNDAFFSLDCSSYVDLGSGFGAVSRHPLVKKLLELYENKEFIREDGSINDVPQPVVLEPVFTENGLKKNGNIQKLGNAVVYPSDYFSPIDYILYQTVRTKNTIGIHHFDDAWHNNSQSKEKQLKIKTAERIKKLLEDPYEN